MIYKEEVLNIEILENKVYPILQITNVDEVFDELIKKHSDDIDVVDERIPYWTEIWPSAVGLSQYIIENKKLFHEKQCIEIGAGLGLPSIVISEYCESILLTDYLEDALLFAEKNTKLNKISNISFDLLDWRNIDGAYKKYDIILASDVAYEKRFFDDLPKALSRLMNENSMAILTEPGRKYAESFTEKLSDHFQVKKENKVVKWRGSDFKIGVYILRKLKQ